MNLSQTPATCLDGGLHKKAIVLAFFSVAFYALIVAIALLATSNALAKPAPQSQSKRSNAATDQPVELGKVQWQRDLDSAVLDSKQQKKPIAILFQEVPG